MIFRMVLALVAALTSLQAGLPEAARYSQRSGETALIVWQDGRIVFERQANGGQPANLFSITKSLAAAGVLRAVRGGVLRLDERVSDTFTGWKSDPQKRRITVRELLAQTSGLATGYEQLYSRNLRDKNARALDLPVVVPPGERFSYGPSHYEVLAALLAAKSPPAISWLTVPFTGVKPDDVRRDRSGQVYFSAGARLSGRQLLDLGQLVRRKGWVAIFPIIPSRLMKEAVTGSAANSMYGLGFWLNLNAGKTAAVERDVEEAIGAGLNRGAWARSCLSRSAPPDLVAMVGSRGQRVYVIPSRQRTDRIRSTEEIINRAAQRNAGGEFRRTPSPHFRKILFVVMLGQFGQFGDMLTVSGAFLPRC